MASTSIEDIHKLAKDSGEPVTYFVVTMWASPRRVRKWMCHPNGQIFNDEGFIQFNVETLRALDWVPRHLNYWDAWREFLVVEKASDKSQ